MPTHDILVLPPNTPGNGGNVHVIGDVHGEIRAFRAVLASLTPSDTLIIAGDLIDRGRDEDDASASSLILDELIALNQAEERSRPLIHAIKGNHEKDFLELMDILNTNQGDRHNPENIEFLLKIIENGGSWIFKGETPNKTAAIEVWSRHYSGKTEYYARAEGVLRGYVSKLLQSDDCDQYLTSRIREYERYIRSLPYIIKIDDPHNPAWVAHADLPMTDEALNDKIKANASLTSTEAFAVTNTRQGHFSMVRSGNSIAKVYCGHNILSENPKTEHNPVLAVRADTQTYNLDGGAYFSGSFLDVNHTQGTVAIITDGSRSIPDFITNAAVEISTNLKATMSSIEQDSPAEESKVVSSAAASQPEREEPEEGSVTTASHAASNVGFYRKPSKKMTDSAKQAEEPEQPAANKSK